jgi:hypothetical protein
MSRRGVGRRGIVRHTAGTYTFGGVSVQPTAVDVEDVRRAKASLPSGRLLLRMSPDLHAELAQAAEQEGTSLNGYITARLRESVGPEAVDAPRPARDGTSTATLTRVLLANAVAVTLAAVVALAILLVAWLG